MHARRLTPRPALHQVYDARRAQRDAEREALEAAQEAEIAAAAAARAAREEEEAAKWRGMFTVEEAGQEALDSEEGEVRRGRGACVPGAASRAADRQASSRAQRGPPDASPRVQKQEARIVEFIRNQKTVELDELAAEFGMKVTDAVALVQRLEAEQKLTGIMDDRGKASSRPAWGLGARGCGGMMRVCVCGGERCCMWTALITLGGVRRQGGAAGTQACRRASGGGLQRYASCCLRTARHLAERACSDGPPCLPCSSSTSPCLNWSQWRRPFCPGAASPSPSWRVCPRRWWTWSPNCPRQPLWSWRRHSPLELQAGIAHWSWRRRSPLELVAA